MSGFAKRLALAMIKEGYIKKKKSWYLNKELDEITGALEQSKLSRDTGITTYTINRHIKQSQNPNVEDLKIYAQALNVSVDWLIGLTDRMSSIEGQVQDIDLITCDDNPRSDIYAVIQEAMMYRGFEENTRYPELIKELFCIASANQHGKPIEDVNLILKLFYVDYLLFLLTIASSSSLLQSEFFKNNVERNVIILNYLFLLLPHQLNTQIDAKLQLYVTTLLELEIRPRTRQSIENLLCITTLSFFWLGNQQSFHMILALKDSGTQIVIDLVNHVIKEQNLPLKSITMKTTQDQDQLHNIRDQIRKIVQKRLA